jgi:hypothetical protein
VNSEGLDMDMAICEIRGCGKEAIAHVGKDRDLCQVHTSERLRIHRYFRLCAERLQQESLKAEWELFNRKHEQMERFYAGETALETEGANA